MDSVLISDAGFSECKADLIEFRNKNRDTVRDGAYFDWRYSGRPSGMEPVIVWALEKGGGPVGALSLIPHHYAVQGVVCSFGVLGDISVAERARGRGIAVRMLKHLMGLERVRKLKASIVLPNAEAARALSKAGWEKVSKIERHIKLLDAGRKFSGRPGSSLLSRSASKALNLCLGISAETFMRIPAEYGFETPTGFDSRFDELWAKGLETRSVIGVRNSCYLDWRYRRHPLDRFEIFLLTKSGQPAGYVVYSMEGASCAVHDFYSGKVPAEYMLASFLRFLKKLPAAAVSLRASRGALDGLNLLKFGFFRRPDFQDVMAWSSGPELPSCKWYFTAGDKDT